VLVVFRREQRDDNPAPKDSLLSIAKAHTWGL